MAKPKVKIFQRNTLGSGLMRQFEEDVDFEGRINEFIKDKTIRDISVLDTNHLLILYEDK